MAKDRPCVWQCGRPTPNISRICDACWREHERLYAERKAREAKAEPKPRTEAQQAALRVHNETRMAKLAKGLPTTDI